MHRAIPVSADRAAPAGPTHPREKPASRRGRAKSRETRTLHWRKADSNHWSPSRRGRLLRAHRDDLHLLLLPRRSAIVTSGTEGSNPACSTRESVKIRVRALPAGEPDLTAPGSCGGNPCWRKVTLRASRPLPGDDDDGPSDGERGTVRCRLMQER